MPNPTHSHVHQCIYIYILIPTNIPAYSFSKSVCPILIPYHHFMISLIPSRLYLIIPTVRFGIYLYIKFQDRELQTKDEPIPDKINEDLICLNCTNSTRVPDLREVAKNKLRGDPSFFETWINGYTPLPPPLSPPQNSQSTLPKNKNPLNLPKAQKRSKSETEKQFPDPHPPTYSIPPHPTTYQLQITTDGPVEISIKPQATTSITQITTYARPLSPPPQSVFLGKLSNTNKGVASTS